MTRKSFTLPRVVVAAIAAICSIPVTAQSVPDAYGVGVSAEVYGGGEFHRDETCVGNGATINPCISLQNPVISGDGTSASALVEGDYTTGTSSGGIAVTHVRSAASADLESGEIHLDFDDTIIANATARFQDTIYINPDDFNGADSLIVSWRLGLDGTFTDSNMFYFFSAQGANDLAQFNASYWGQGLSTPQDIGSPEYWDVTSYGDWSVLGPQFFEGQLTVSAANPFFVVESQFGGSGRFADFSNTAHLSMILPDGVRYTSASGVFLAAVTPGVPEPSTWAMMLLGFGFVGSAMRRRKIGALANVAYDL